MTCAHPVPPWLDLDAARIGIRIAGNGSYQVVSECPECGTLTGPIGHYTVARLGIDIAHLNVLRDYRGTLGRCSRRGCELEAVEDHHFAPVAIFGEEADAWPRALLCVGHHLEWHRRMRAA